MAIIKGGQSLDDNPERIFKNGKEIFEVYRGNSLVWNRLVDLPNPDLPTPDLPNPDLPNPDETPDITEMFRELEMYGPYSSESEACNGGQPQDLVLVYIDKDEAAAELGVILYNSDGHPVSGNVYYRETDSSHPGVTVGVNGHGEIDSHEACPGSGFSVEDHDGFGGI